jgi:hypothetical protein
MTTYTPIETPVEVIALKSFPHRSITQFVTTDKQFTIQAFVAAEKLI